MGMGKDIRMPELIRWPLDGYADDIPESWRTLERNYNRILTEAIEEWLDGQK
jgi:hypothetical protein